MKPVLPVALSSLYQLKISLVGITPQVWRRVLVPGNVNLATVHRVIQLVMGWDDAHQHEFLCAGQRYGDPSFAAEASVPYLLDEAQARLDIVESHFCYHYDFGDGWMHKIAVERKRPAAPDSFQPVCIGGKRACPPEDCGGPWGYKKLLTILKDPQHPEYLERQEWVGGDLDPERFDLSGVNRQLRQYFSQESESRCGLGSEPVSSPSS